MTFQERIESLDQKGGLRALAIGLIVAVMIFFAANITTSTQLAVGVVGIASLIVLKFFKKNENTRVVFLSIGAFLSLDYLFWRTFTTLTYYDLVSFTCAILLYLAEMYGFIIYGLSIFVNIDPLDRKPAPLPADEAEWPTVDVLIPTYNEEKEILEITLLAALAIEYPKEKLKVYLCDDGGTDQRCNASDPIKAALARDRRRALKDLCEKAGAHYCTRARNIHAKAGNLNNGMEHSSGELVLILDADHIPTVDFLRNTVGWFLKDPKMFLVQTPHFFTNPDPIEKNLKTWRKMPSENEMFYKVIQKGLDFWNAAFFCGSAAVMRRSCLEKVGGIVGETITEDAETALTLHSLGFNSAYIDRPMVSGLSPETLGGFITQRIRWAQGMVQIFLLKNPMLVRGLSFPQRLCYFSSSFFWFFPFARLTFSLAPAAFLFFSLKIYDSNFIDFLAFAMPHLISAFMVQAYLFGSVRWSFVSELYELMQSVYTFPAIVKVFLNPRAPSFNVTAKGEILNRDFISPLAKPFYVLLVVNLLCIFAGTYRTLFDPVHEFAIGITMFWALFNIFILFACLGALLERRQMRSTARMAAKIPGRLILGDRKIPVDIMDISNGGAALAIDEAYESQLLPDQLIQLEPDKDFDIEPGIFHIEIRNLRYRDRTLMVGCSFKHQSLEEMKRKITFVNGSSRRWMEFQFKREKAIGVWGSFVYLLGAGVRFSIEHLGVGLLGTIRRDRESRTFGSGAPVKP
ncbi:MAG: UDP-forming cellulose synthase catalytic subunit [Terrimicrobiaceae bacterium]|nr:UDP-forming cellulose synthase catalytic subunit [Terrimicrobiaceae bacterium]